MADFASRVAENAVNYIYYSVFMKCRLKRHKLKCKLFWGLRCRNCEPKGGNFDLCVTVGFFFCLTIGFFCDMI